MPRNKRSFLERLTGVVENENEFLEDEEFEAPYEDSFEHDGDSSADDAAVAFNDSGWDDEDVHEDDDEKDGELMVDVYEMETEIVIQTMVAGVAPEDVDISITQESVTIKGRREEPQDVSADDYITQELYWGPFSRTITLTQEIEADKAEAMEKNGLLIIRLPKVDKEEARQLHVRSI